MLAGAVPLLAHGLDGAGDVSGGTLPGHGPDVRHRWEQEHAV